MKKTVEAYAKCFIIPNHAGTIESYIFGGDYRKEVVKSICDANLMEFNEKAKLVQIWFVSEDLHSNNLSDHGFYTTIDGEEYRCHLPSYSCCLPKGVLPTHENDIVELIIPNCTAEPDRRKSDKKEEIVFDLHLNLEADQLNYRYASFGRFEQVLDYVCR